mmetsp:Transcript_29612/g.66700  ORF Transcript_29612/g.66700 Transcript_29612/m.66700 type:complete len:316 (+) Transcript_29612:20-967(+)
MADGYERFLSYDWSDERWRTYLNGLYPPPTQEQIVKFKKKWYKKHVEPEFDDRYEPPASGHDPSSIPATPEELGPLPKSIYHDGSRWGVIGPKSSICFAAYAASLTLCVGCFAGVFPAYQAVIILVVSFLLEIMAKYGIKMNKAFMQNVLLDDVGIMPIMAATVLMPGLHPKVRQLALLPLFLTAVMSLAQISKFHPKLPGAVRDFWSPLASSKARKQVMKVRADLELLVGFAMLAGGFLFVCAPISVILFWNFMMMRYMMSTRTQESFQRLDGLLSPVFGRVPGVKQAYQALKTWLYSFVDPNSKSAGKLCTIL